MNFEWKMPKDSKTTFEEKVHNLACFEIVLNIFRMKARAGDEDTSDEMQAFVALRLSACLEIWISKTRICLIL